MSGAIELLDDEPPAASVVQLSPQDVTRASLKLTAATLGDAVDAYRSDLAMSADDSEESVRAWVRERLPGCELPGRLVWLRLWRNEDPRGVLAVLHGLIVPAEMQLMVFANRGAITRSVLRVLAGWAFRHVGAVGLHRLAVRLPEDATELLHLARRAGFRDEGRATGHYADGRDALLLGMARGDCPWLLPPLNDPAAQPAPSATRH